MQIKKIVIVWLAYCSLACAEFSIAAIVKVADPYIELHTGPGQGHPIDHVAVQGDTIEVLRQRTDWFKVKLASGKTGWVSQLQLERTLDEHNQQIKFVGIDHGHYLKRRWEIGMSSGDFDGSALVSIYTGYRLTKNLSAETTLSQGVGSFSKNDLVALQLIHSPFQEAKWAPLFGIGTGIIHTTPKTTLGTVEDRTDDFLLITAAVKTYLSQRFFLRADYRNYIVLTSQETNRSIDAWKIGLSFFF